MGYYIQTPENKGKAAQLVALHNAEELAEVMAFAEIPDGKALVCVVDNGPFEAAALCFSEQEQQEFNTPGDMRSRSWLLMDRALAHELAGYEEAQQ
jgi:anti-sigma regulatory factor (Ser/Thr protein kinase)